MTRFFAKSFWFLLAPLLFGEERVEFNRDIRPIFTKHCTGCHGGVKEAGGVSLIDRGKALAEGESGLRTIFPGKPAESELVKRIRSRNPDEVMPKPKHGPPLAEREIATIERWIAQGAEWQSHWAFVPPVETEISGISGSQVCVFPEMRACLLVPLPSGNTSKLHRLPFPSNHVVRRVQRSDRV